MVEDITDLKAFRTLFGVSRSEFSEMLGFERKAVARWESGENKISKRSLERINNVLFPTPTHKFVWTEEKLSNPINKKRSLWKRIIDWIF